MDFKNKYLVNTLRILLGLYLLFSGVMGFIGGPAAEGTPELMVEPMQNLWDTGLLQVAKVVEILAGLMLVLSVFPAIGIIFTSIIAVGVTVFNSTLTPTYAIPGIVMAMICAYFGWVYWDKYKELFTR